MGIVVENIFQSTDIGRLPQALQGQSVTKKAATGVTPYSGLANSGRPLPIARNQSYAITSGASIQRESGCSGDLYAPRLADVARKRIPNLISCLVGELRPHPSYARHGLAVEAPKLSALADRGDAAFCNPIAITHDRIVIDGYARWELAKRTGLERLDCFEHDLSSEEALGELIRTHSASRGLPDFVRIELALDLEPYFQEKALVNQQAGGKTKGLSKLTIAHRVDTRREVARLAAVSAGNVRKTKYILAHAHGSLLQAVRTKEVSINLAERLSHESPAQQQESLRLLRIERGIQKKARNLVAAHLAQLSGSKRSHQVFRLPDLVCLLNQSTASTAEKSAPIGAIEVKVLSVPGQTIFVTQDLISLLTPVLGEPNR